MKLILLFFIVFATAAVFAHKVQKCFPVPKVQCPEGEEYLTDGPGPFCYPTCCGPRGPACRLDSFTTGCFCKEGFVKMFPVANNTGADLNNPCVRECDFSQCGGRS